MTHALFPEMGAQALRVPFAFPRSQSGTGDTLSCQRVARVQGNRIKWSEGSARKETHIF